MVLTAAAAILARERHPGSSEARDTGMEPIRITMELEKETKNTVRYAEKAEGKPPAIGTLYIQKWATSPDAPKLIAVVVEAAD
jgi:hypothetical protein